MSTSHKKKKPLPYFFHPREIAFCGLSGSGKTTLLEKIVTILSPDYSIGYVKSDAHRFSMDTEGKDTYKIKESGAKNILINDKDHHARIDEGNFSENFVYQNFIDRDFVLIEGYKHSNIPKIIVLDEKCEILDNVVFDDSVIAVVGPSKDKPVGIEDKIYHHRDDGVSISSFIIEHFKKKSKETPIYGLVLGGGKSQRMGEDKNFLKLNGQALSEKALKTLDPFCDKVFFSSRPGQFTESPFNYPLLVDEFLGMGPLGGLLSAQKKYPNASWLVLACDLPSVNESTISHLTKNRNPFRLATAFRSEYVKHPEPLCAIWEPLSYTRSLQILARGFACPRNVLRESRIELLEPITKGALDNANTPEEFQRILKENHL